MTRDAQLGSRINALHNTGYARAEGENVNWYGDVPVGWGHGRRMGELQGALARVQLRRLDTILLQMRASHNRIESFLQSLGMVTRVRADQLNPGDTGYYCQFHLPSRSGSEAVQIAHGREVAAVLKNYGLRPWFMHDFEVHVYYNIPSLVERWPLNNGGPWPNTVGPSSERYHYHRGVLPNLDRLLISTLGINVPSQLTPSSEEYIQSVLRYVVSEMLTE